MSEIQTSYIITTVANYIELNIDLTNQHQSLDHTLVINDTFCFTVTNLNNCLKSEHQITSMDDVLEWTVAELDSYFREDLGEFNAYTYAEAYAIMQTPPWYDDSI
jgi:hypothetical protein